MSYTWPEHFQPDVVKDAFGGGRLSSYCLALEAWRRGLTVTITHPRLFYFEVSDGEQTVYFNNSKPSPLTTDEAFRMVENKNQTTDAMRAAGVSAPVTVLFESNKCTFDQVSSRASEFDYPVVLKPVSGSKGNGVIAGIADEQELKTSYDWLVNEFGAKKFVLEKFYSGNDYRIYVVGGKYTAAGIRVPANVVGDGVSTINDLIDSKNKSRAGNPFLAEAPIKKDFEVSNYVTSQNYTFDSVPALGTYIRLRGKANASAGGDFFDCTDDLPQHIREAAARSVEAIPGLAAAGVDVLYDEDKPRGEDHVVIELNARAHIGVNMYPTGGVGRDLPKAIIDSYFPDSQRMQVHELDRLALNLRDLTTPLRSKTAQAVRATPIPQSGLPVREVYKYPSETLLSLAQKNRLVVASRKCNISGFIDGSRNSVMLAGNFDDVQKFKKSFNVVTKSTLYGKKIWKGRVQIGFTIKDGR